MTGHGKLADRPIEGGMTKKDYDRTQELVNLSMCSSFTDRTKANITGLVTEFTDQATLMLSGSVSEESQEKMRRLRVLVDHQMRVYKLMKRRELQHVVPNVYGMVLLKFRKRGTRDDTAGP